MSLYSVNNIFNESIVMNNINTESSSIISECFEFNKAIYIETCRYNKELSYSILEGKSTEVFIRVIKLLNSIIDRIIKFILEMGKRISRELNNNIDNSAVLQNKKIIQNFNKSFVTNDFNYTILNTIPDIEYLDKLRNHIFIANTVTVNNIDSVYRSQDSYNSETNLDKVRGKIISGKPITSSDFSTELFKVFRNGKNEPSEIKIDHSNIMQYYKIIEDYNKTIANISNEERNIINKISKIKSTINEGTLQSDILDNKFELLYNGVLTEVDNITRLYTIALSYKYDSVISQYRFSKNILLTAIQMGGDTIVNN